MSDLDLVILPFLLIVVFAAVAFTVEWLPAAVVFVDRIPPKMAELIDDLVYRLRKERRGAGAAPTKQALTCEAIGDLLKKYQVVR